MTPESKDLSSFQGISEVSFPLHPNVESEERVSRLVQQFLGTIRDEETTLNHTDVLQALAITTAIRLAVAEANHKPGIEMAIELIDVATDSLTRATIDTVGYHTPSVQ